MEEPQKDKAAELEIRLRLTKEQVIFEIQVLISYAKEILPDLIPNCCKILANTDFDEIAEERTGLEKCNNPTCLKKIAIPKMPPKFQFNEEKKIMEKFDGKYFCSKKCEKELAALQKQAQNTIESHQLTDIAKYYEICEKYQNERPNLVSLKTQLKTLSEQFFAAMSERPKTHEKKEAKIEIKNFIPI